MSALQGGVESGETMITAIMGVAVPGVPDEVMPYLAMNKDLCPDLGTRPGQWLYHGTYLAQVTARKDATVHLVGVGWVDLAECRLVE